MTDRFFQYDAGIRGNKIGLAQSLASRAEQDGSCSKIKYAHASWGRAFAGRRSALSVRLGIVRALQIMQAAVAILVRRVERNIMQAMRERRPRFLSERFARFSSAPFLDTFGVGAILDRRAADADDLTFRSDLSVNVAAQQRR